MFDRTIFGRLDHLFDRSHIVDVSDSDRIVVLSDLHMADGSGYDGFTRTSRLFSNILERYYLENGFKLVLNGDVEDLLRTSYQRIMERWGSIYSIFDRFRDETSLFKLLGNHDIRHLWMAVRDLAYSHYEGLRLRFGNGELFVYHGHQASRFVDSMLSFQRIAFGRLINHLRIPNPSVQFGKEEDMRTKERRIMDFSMRKKVLSLVAHTHRPSFGGGEPIPTMFNSGCSTGKRGITSLEIENGSLSLVHWWDRNILGRHVRSEIIDRADLGGADAYRVVMDSAPLRTLFRPCTV